MEPFSVDRAATLSELVRALSEGSRTCLVRVTDGSREGRLRFEQGEIVEISFGHVRGASAMLALMNAVGLRYEFIEPAPAARAAPSQDEPKRALHEAAAGREPDAAAERASRGEPRFDADEDTADEDTSAALAAYAAERAAAADAAAQAIAALAAQDGAELVDAFFSVDSEGEAPPESFSAREGRAIRESSAASANGSAELARPTEDEDEDEDEAAPTAVDEARTASSPHPPLALDEAPRAEAEANAAGEAEAAPSASVPPELDRAQANDEAAAHAAGDEQAARIALELDQTPEQEPAPSSAGEAEAALGAPVPELDADPAERPLDAATTAVAARGSGWPRPEPSQAKLLWVAVAACAAVAAAALLWRQTGEPDGTPGARDAAEPGALGAVADRRAAEPGRQALGAAATGVADRPPQWLEGPPALAPQAALVPTILLRVLVDADGRVREAKVDSPRPALRALEQQALETAERQRFRPATRAGKPLAAWTTLALAFRPARVERTLVIKGSDTIGTALAPAWAEAFQKAQQPGLSVRVEALGSQSGFAGLIDGTADLAASSQPIGDEALALADKLGVQLLELVVGYDGVAAIVHPQNPVRELELDALARVFAQRVTQWSELSGGDAAIRVLGRPHYSGTHDAFQQRVLASRVEDAAFGPSIERVEASREVVARVASDPHAIGYVSFGLVQPSVRALALRPAPGAPAVAPSPASLRDGSYPIARPLLLYLRGDSGRDARAFVDFVRAPAGQATLAEHGFVPVQAAAGGALSEQPSPSAKRPDLVRIYFASGNAGVLPGAWNDIRASAAALRDGGRALLVGNADSSGDPLVNRRVAQRRAQVIATILRQYGIGDAVLELAVAGSDYPLASNETSEGRSANRRVDLYVFPR